MRLLALKSGSLSMVELTATTRPPAWADAMFSVSTGNTAGACACDGAATADSRPDSQQNSNRARFNSFLQHSSAS
jgi:hypothetical protein